MHGSFLTATLVISESLLKPECRGEMRVTKVQGTAGSCCQEPFLLKSPGAHSSLTCDMCCELPGGHFGDSILRLFTGALAIIYHVDILCLHTHKSQTFRRKAGDTGRAITQRPGLYLSVDCICPWTFIHTCKPRSFTL